MNWRLLVGARLRCWSRAKKRILRAFRGYYEYWNFNLSVIRKIVEASVFSVEAELETGFDHLSIFLQSFESLAVVTCIFFLLKELNFPL